jgi:hypothetical protein
MVFANCPVRGAHALRPYKNAYIISCKLLRKWYYITAGGTVLFRYTWATLLPDPQELPTSQAAPMLANVAD